MFCGKSVQSVENKGRERKKERQESSRVCKRLEVKEIEEVGEVEELGKGLILERGASEATVRRVITGYGRTDYRICQDIK